MKHIATMQLTVEYSDARGVTADEICRALNLLLSNAMDSHDVLDEVGNPTVSDLEVVEFND